MYFTEIVSYLEAGKKTRRLGWPKGKYLAMLNSTDIELSDDERKAVGLSLTAEVKANSVLVLCENKDKAEFGYQLVHDDKMSQDWEVL